MVFVFRAGNQRKMTTWTSARAKTPEPKSRIMKRTKGTMPTRTVVWEQSGSAGVCVSVSVCVCVSE